MIFAALALTFFVAAVAAESAQPDLEMKGSPPAPHTAGPPPAASTNSTLSLPGRALTITAGADACSGRPPAFLPPSAAPGWTCMTGLEAPRGITAAATGWTHARVVVVLAAPMGTSQAYTC